MKALQIINSTFVPVNIENIDTDQIIPARFLKATTRDASVKTYLEIGDMKMMMIQNLNHSFH